MAVREYKLPDPGEGLTEAEIVTWQVKVGDVVEVVALVAMIPLAVVAVGLVGAVA